MFLMWIAGVWLGTNIAVVAVLVALAERGQRREAAIPRPGRRASHTPAAPKAATRARRCRARLRPPSPSPRTGSRPSCASGMIGRMPFARILVAIDGSQGATGRSRRRSTWPGSRARTVTALAIEGPLPAYAATIGEVDEVKRQKDRFFARVAEDAREQARGAGVTIEVEVRAGHAASLITAYAREHGVRPRRRRAQGPLPRGLRARLDRRPGRPPRSLPRHDRQVAIARARAGGQAGPARRAELLIAASALFVRADRGGDAGLSGRRDVRPREPRLPVLPELLQRPGRHEDLLRPQQHARRTCSSSSPRSASAWP